MTPAVFNFVQQLRLKGKTLDIGSTDINGCVRELFDDYIGVDINPGFNVDLVMDAHSLKFGDQTFDNVLSLEMLEHDSEFWTSVKEMKRVLKPGGNLVITTRWFSFPPHNPPDYWRFSGDALGLLLADMDIKYIVHRSACNGVFAHAVKKATG